jgi:hypothetical protein
MFVLPHSHGGNTGSNPVGDANFINVLRDRLVARVSLLSKIWPINTPGRTRTAVLSSDAYPRCLAVSPQPLLDCGGAINQVPMMVAWTGGPSELAEHIGRMCPEVHPGIAASVEEEGERAPPAALTDR